jgi:ABC-type phosphate/phosphonate transport system substrate-binding protein
MVASLPMYDLPELREATDEFWHAVARAAGLDGELLRVPDYHGVWRRPDLAFSQTCGYPLTHEFSGTLKLIATPHYSGDGNEGPNYRSIAFAREPLPLSAFQGKRAAYNNLDSMSGMLALKIVFAPFAEGGRFFSSAIETGGHFNSMKALQEGRADVCTIDTVCVELARRHRPEALEGLVEVARSPEVPALPFVTVAGDVSRLRAALNTVFADPGMAAVREKLLLNDLSILSMRDYDRIRDLEDAMEKAGGLRLA